MTSDDSLIDSAEAFNDHHRWHSQYPFARTKSYTLKAEPKRSFQPQAAAAELIDIVPRGQLKARLRAGSGTRPLRVERSAAAAAADQLRLALTHALVSTELRARRLVEEDYREGSPLAVSRDPRG